MMEINFNGAPLSLGYLSRILEALNRDGELTIKGIAKNSISILELAAALGHLAPIPMPKAYVHRMMVGWTAKDRVQNQTELWIAKRGQHIYRTSYRHKLLRYPVVIENAQPIFDA